jgi:hypothetical protein
LSSEEADDMELSSEVESTGDDEGSDACSNSTGASSSKATEGSSTSPSSARPSSERPVRAGRKGVCYKDPATDEDDSP